MLVKLSICVESDAVVSDFHIKACESIFDMKNEVSRDWCEWFYERQASSGSNNLVSVLLCCPWWLLMEKDSLKSDTQILNFSSPILLFPLCFVVSQMSLYTWSVLGTLVSVEINRWCIRTRKVQGQRDSLSVNSPRIVLSYYDYPSLHPTIY